MQVKDVVGYLRVSTANQVENGEGLEIQRDRIMSHCKDKGLTLRRFYEDRGVSGGIRDRVGLLELLKDCESNKIKKVIVYKQDRLARDLTISLWLETQFKKHDVEENVRGKCQTLYIRGKCQKMSDALHNPFSGSTL